MSQKNQELNEDEDLDYDFEEEYEDYDFEDFEDFEENELEERQALIEEINEFANDNVEENKTYEEYVKEKNEEELFTFLGPQIITKTPEEIDEIKKNIKKYILENQREIVKENMIYMPDSVINEIQNTAQNGIIEIDLEEDIQEILKIAKYDLLRKFGMAFMSLKGNKVIIHIPLIREMKKCIEDKELMKKQSIMNEKVHLILGICEVHGAIKTKIIYHLMEEFYGKTNKEEFAKFILMVGAILGVCAVKINKKTRSIQFIYQNWLDEEMAKEIIKANKEVKTHTKEEYLRYGTENYLINTKGYKKLKEQFDDDIFDEDDLFELLNNLVIPYTVEARMGNKNLDEIMQMMIRQLVDVLGEEGLIELGLDTKEIEKALQEIVEELPKWIE